MVWQKHSSITGISSSYWQRTASPFPFVSELPAYPHVVVVGGGIVGAATAYWLARTEIPVVLLEQEGVAAGATGRNAGFVGIGPCEEYPEAITRLGHGIARAVLHLTLENRALLRQVIDEEGIACDYREPGHLHLALDEAQLQVFERIHLMLERDGVSTHVLDREQIRQFIHTPLGVRIVGALLVPEVGLVHPVKLTQGLVRAAQHYGARLITARVVNMRTERDHIRLETDIGAIYTQKVIMAVNAWTERLLPLVERVMVPVRGQILAYQAQVPAIFETGVTANISGCGEYWQQTPDGTIVLGGCRGVAEGHEVGVRSSEPTEDVQGALEQVLPQLFPDLARLQVLQRWAGLMAFTPDLLPIADYVPGLPNALVAGGFSGHGMPFALRLGQLLAQASMSNLLPAALYPFRLDRPTLK